MSDRIEKIAEYFTDSVRVCSNSMALAAPGARASEAKCFFDARSALCISGYMTKEEAIEVLKEIMVVK